MRPLPGRRPGYRDHADPRQARFHNPQGIATDPDGNVITLIGHFRVEY